MNLTSTRHIKWSELMIIFFNILLFCFVFIVCILSVYPVNETWSTNSLDVEVSFEVYYVLSVCIHYYYQYCIIKYKKFYLFFISLTTIILLFFVNLYTLILCIGTLTSFLIFKCIFHFRPFNPVLKVGNSRFNRDSKDKIFDISIFIILNMFFFSLIIYKLYTK